MLRRIKSNRIENISINRIDKISYKWHHYNTLYVLFPLRNIRSKTVLSQLSLKFTCPAGTSTCPATHKGELHCKDSAQNITCSSLQVKVLFCLPHCRFLLNSLTTCNGASGYVARCLFSSVQGDLSLCPHGICDHYITVFFLFSPQYKWIRATEPQDPMKVVIPRKRRTRTLNCSFGRKTTIRVSGVLGVPRKIVNKPQVTGNLLIFLLESGGWGIDT